MTDPNTSSRLSPLFGWRGHIADKDSGLTPTERHVALTLSLHMNERGGSCWPSVATLVDETGLSRRAVQKSLAALRDQGWIEVENETLNGGRSITAHYHATVPGGAPDAPPSEKGAPDDVERAHLTTEKGAPDAPEDVSSASTKDVSKNNRARAREHWLELPGMTQHRESYFDTKINRKLDQAIAKYGVDDLCSAMTAYAEILAHDDYYWTHRWTLGDFLTRGLDRFVPEAMPYNTFMVSTKNPGTFTPEQIRDRALESQKKEREHEQV